MNLYKISQEQNRDYDTFDSAIVCAPDAETARSINPENGEQMKSEDWDCGYISWCNDIKHVKVELIGVAVDGSDQGVKCASFNAG